MKRLKKKCLIVDYTKFSVASVITFLALVPTSRFVMLNKNLVYNAVFTGVMLMTIELVFIGVELFIVKC